MINILKKILFYLFIIFVIIFLIFISTYTFIIKKPEESINFVDRFFLKDYSLEFENLEGNSKLIEPVFSFDKLEVSKDGNKSLELIGFKLGTNIPTLIFKRHLVFSIFEIEDISFTGNTKATNNYQNFKIYVNKFLIKNSSFNFYAENGLLKYSNQGFLGRFHSGNINDIPFFQIDFFNKESSNKLFFHTHLNIDKEYISNNQIFDTENLSNYEINLDVTSKGFFDLNTNKLKSIEKYFFKNSNITTKDLYKIQKIDLTLFSDLKKLHYGTYTASLPDQDIAGSIEIDKEKLLLRFLYEVNLGEVISNSKFFSVNGKQKFESKLEINNNKSSILLKSGLRDVQISSFLSEMNKDYDEKLTTSIYIDDLSNPTYLIDSKRYKAYFGDKNQGYLSYGDYFDDQLTPKKYNNEFNLFLTLKNLSYDDFIIENEQTNENIINSISIYAENFEFQNNTFSNQEFRINFEDKNINTTLIGKNLNGSLIIDDSDFVKVTLNNSNFDNKFSELFEANSNVGNILNMRVVGKNIKLNNELFNDIDFYLLSNRDIITVNNIKIKSRNINIGQYKNSEKAFISYDKSKDLIKIRGSYKFDNKNKYLDNFFNVDFEYLSTDLYIQWESTKNLKNLEGNIIFLIKGFESKSSLPDSTFLRAMKVLNLNALLDNIDNSNIIDDKDELFIKRASGNLYVSKSRALITKPIKLETNEASMTWVGDIQKNKDGILEALDLDLSMRLKISENIPWYAAIFGGIPALAGGIVFENIFDDTIDDVSTFKFNISGSIDEPEIIRLD